MSPSTSKLMSKHATQKHTQGREEKRLKWWTNCIMPISLMFDLFSFMVTSFCPYHHMKTLHIWGVPLIPWKWAIHICKNKNSNSICYHQFNLTAHLENWMTETGTVKPRNYGLLTNSLIRNKFSYINLNGNSCIRNTETYSM